MRELQLLSPHHLEWRETDDPSVQQSTDAVVRPIVVSRCDGDILPVRNRLASRGLQVGLRTGVVDPAVGHICGPTPFAGPFAIGHECIAEVIATGSDVDAVSTGDIVAVPWSVSCGQCETCQRGLTSKCETTRRTGNGMRTLAAYGFGPACGPYGGMIADLLRVPHANHMLVKVPPGVDPLRVAAASDNLSDAWRTVVPHIKKRPDSTVLIIGGGAQSIGLYAAGLAVAHGARSVTYVDDDAQRRGIAARFGATTTPQKSWMKSPRGYDIVVDASSTTTGIRSAIRSTASGGICTGVGYYVRTNTGIPLMHMYAHDITLHLGVSHPRPILPELLSWIATHDFPAEIVTTQLMNFDDAPHVYAQQTIKLVLHRDATTHQQKPSP